MKLVKGIYLPDYDTHFEGMLDDDGNYQKKQFDAVLKYIIPENRGLFIDVGAHVGLWSLMAFKSGFQQILGFEPDAENFMCLNKNLDLSGIKARCERRALSDITDVGTTRSEKRDNSGAKILVTHEDKENRDYVPLTPFDRIYDSGNISEDYKRKTLIKIDVQGYEAKVVRGMTNFIKEYKPIIIVEQWLDGKEDLEATQYCEFLGMKVLEKVKKEVILGW